MAVSSFIPELWASRLYYNLEKAHIAKNLVNRDYEGEIRRKGDTVHINSVGAITVGSYTANSDMNSPEQLSTTDKELEIDQAKYFNFEVDDVDHAQVAGDIMEKAMNRAAIALRDPADSYILSCLAGGAAAANTIGTTASPIALTASNIYSYLVQLGVRLDKQNVPSDGRTICLPPDAYGVLKTDTAHFQIAERSTGEAAVVNGYVGRMAGFDIYVSNNCVYDSTHTCWAITAQHPVACTYAEQIVETEAYRMEKRFADGVKGLLVYGCKVVIPESIALIYCTLSF